MTSLCQAGADLIKTVITLVKVSAGSITQTRPRLNNVGGTFRKIFTMQTTVAKNCMKPAGGNLKKHENSRLKYIWL